jgi:hypothetical protein
MIGLVLNENKKCKAGLPKEDLCGSCVARKLGCAFCEIKEIAALAELGL